ncbi:MAG: hypothetical protein ACJ8GN_29905 [Longimicrobiaceae bacterium]
MVLYGLGFALIMLVLTGRDTFSQLLDQRISLLYTGVTLVALGFLVDVWHRMEIRLERKLDEIQANQDEVGDRVLSSVKGERSNVRAGIERVYENTSVAAIEVPKLAKQTKYQLDILGISLRQLIRSDLFIASLEELLTKGVRVRVLLLHPNSKFRAYSHEQPYTPAEQKMYIDRWRRVAAHLAHPDHQIAVRLYDSVPTEFLVIADSTVIFSTFLPVTEWIDVPCVQISGGNKSLRSSWCAYFEHIYASASSAII